MDSILKKVLQFYIVLVVFVSFSVAQVSPNKLCIDKYEHDSCQQVARDQDINCKFVVAKTDCILDIDQGQPTLTAVDAEEAFLGASLVTRTTTVIGEIVGEHPPYKTVVIVKSGYLGGFEQLRGLKYCHPGYNHDERITRYVLEQLDWKAISLPCNDTKTLVEQKFEALSLLFGNSCRPGKWSEDDVLDASLKNQSSSLCQLCGDNGCNTEYKVPLNDTLTCLTDNKADVALSALSYAQSFFNIGSNAQNYQYLCPNGTLAPFTNPCTWTDQLNRLLITSSASGSLMQNYIQTKVPSYINSSSVGSSSSVIEEHLALLLGLRRTDKINLITPKPLSTYVSERRAIPAYNDSIKCGLVLKWSVTNDLELNKCQWLQQASLNTGLQPVISCVSSSDNDTVANLDNIKKNGADIAFADANFGYIARRKNLSNVAYPETDSRQLSKIVIVVKNNTDWYTGFKSLQGKEICLPEYGGKEWLAFIDLLRTSKILDDNCDYGKLFSDFVGESCAPGANSKDLDIPNTDSEKLCKNCYPVDATTTAKYCNADSKNKYYDSLGALKCLEESNGDYAVIALSDLPYDYRTNNEIQQQFRVISKNGSLAAYNGFNVDEGAPITIIVAGEVVTKNGTAKYNDTVLYLRDIEYEFGLSPRKSFKVFEVFDGTRNLLFPDSTPGLTFGGSPNKYIENFKKLLENAETCQAVVSSSFSIVPTVLVIFIMTAFATFI